MPKFDCIHFYLLSGIRFFKQSPHIKEGFFGDVSNHILKGEGGMDQVKKSEVRSLHLKKIQTWLLGATLSSLLVISSGMISKMNGGDG